MNQGMSGFHLGVVPESHWRIWTNRTGASAHYQDEGKQWTVTSRVVPIPYQISTDRMVPLTGRASSLQYNLCAILIDE